VLACEEEEQIGRGVREGRRRNRLTGEFAREREIPREREITREGGWEM
jgi:hypothetical protein